MVAEDIRKELLADAAACAGPLPGAGDLAVCLRAYYRHVADDDLTAAGAERPGPCGQALSTARMVPSGAAW